MRALSILAMATLVLGACAHPWHTVNMPPGTPRDQVIAQAGPPFRVLPMPNGGQRLQYTLQPTGRYAFMLDFDAGGRLVSSRQVLNEADFNRIVVDRWTRDDVLYEFGPPARVDAVTSFQGAVMTYRWMAGNEPMFFWVYVDPQGIVRRAHPGMEFLNAPSRGGL